MSAVEWRDALGYNGDYEVSSDGRVRRVAPGRGARAGHILQPCVTRAGYHQVALRRDGRTESRLVSQLVCEAFHGARPDGMEVRHLDGDSRNDTPANLEWGTHFQNMQDMRRHGTHANSLRTHCKNGHEFTPENTVPRGDNGGRRCRTCRDDSYRRRARRRQESGAA